MGSGFQEDLLAVGAVDFYFTAIQMKKGRPGTKLSVLVNVEDRDRVSSFLLEHTSSIGVRHHAVTRTILAREQYEVQTPYGTIEVKQVTTPSGANRYKIEYESLRKLQEQHDIPIFKLAAQLYPLLSKNPHHEKK